MGLSCNYGIITYLHNISQVFVWKGKSGEEVWDGGMKGKSVVGLKEGIGVQKGEKESLKERNMRGQSQIRFEVETMHLECMSPSASLM